jgi:hypothetical protein
MMPKKQTTITTPVKRPETLGATIKLKSIEDVDAALAELAWLKSRQDVVDATMQELHAAVEVDRPKAETILVEGEPLFLCQRVEQLDEAVSDWLPKHLEKLLPEKGNTLKREHGQLTTKSVATYIRPIGELTEEQVIEKIEAASQPQSQIMTKVRGICAVFFCRAAKVLFGDLITIKVTPNKTGRLAAWKEGRLTAAMLKPLGLEVVSDEKTYSYKLN